MDNILVDLHKLLIDRFDEGELRILCFYLGEHYDNLPGEGKVNKARELVSYIERRDRITELIEIGSQLRPDIIWMDIPGVEHETPFKYQDTLPEHSRIEFAVRIGDITEFDADVIALKFAQEFYGADWAVAMALGNDVAEFKNSIPALGEYGLFHTFGQIKAKRALFVSVPPLEQLDYGEIRSFAKTVLEVLASDAPLTCHLAMTIHGVGYGLDESESLRSQLAGFLDAFDSNKFPAALEQITIVELDPSRAQRLDAVLSAAIPGNFITLPKVPIGRPRDIKHPPLIRNVGRESTNKPHILVAIPPAEEMDDVYYYGIQAPVNAAGYLCEKVNLVDVKTEILKLIKSRIDTASYLIAELTAADPGIYLLVGYAWGKNRPTILLAKDSENLPFDVQGQRCLIYNRIRDLERDLSQELCSSEEIF